jgi:flagellar basal-body rod protein FlgB
MSGKIFDSTYSTVRKVLDLRMKQHGLSTANLANQDTPQFKARRIDFKSAFDRVLLEDSSASMRLTDSRHIDALPTGAARVETLEAPAWAEDGNSVNREEEMAVMVSNNLVFNATVEALSRKLALLKYAASDGGR